MEVELVWGDGITVHVQLPRRVSADEFLEKADELEYLVDRGKSRTTKRWEKIQEEIDRLQEEAEEEPVVSEDDALFREFLAYKQRRAQSPPEPPAPRSQPPQTPPQRQQPERRAAPQRQHHLPPLSQPPQTYGHLEERLERLEQAMDRIINFLDSLGR